MLRYVFLFFCMLQVGLFGQGTPYSMDLAIEAAGPYSTGAQWNARVFNADVIDAVAANPMSYPTLAPGNPYGWALANLLRLRWNRAVNRLSTPYPSHAGALRLTKLYSSSWIVENDDITIGIDVVEGPFASFGFSGAVGLPELAAMAAKLDILFITHLDGDHCSPNLMYNMILLGKPIVCSLDLGLLAIALGAPPSQIYIPGNGTHTITLANGKTIQFDCYNGTQRGGTPSEVDCNAYNILSDIGEQIVHCGDTDDMGLNPYLANNNWDADYLIQEGYATLPFDIRFLSHELEFTHFGDAHFKLNMPANAPMPLSRFVLMWGESLTF